MNPCPGNIKDGLITDAIKSTGAARRGGTSPVVSVLDYTEPVTTPGLSNGNVLRLRNTANVIVENATYFIDTWGNAAVKMPMIKNE